MDVSLVLQSLTYLISRSMLYPGILLLIVLVIGTVKLSDLRLERVKIEKLLHEYDRKITKRLERAGIIAFGTTVLGLCVGGVGYVIVTIRGRWYDQDMSDIEYLTEILYGN